MPTAKIGELIVTEQAPKSLKLVEVVLIERIGIAHSQAVLHGQFRQVLHEGGVLDDTEMILGSIRINDVIPFGMSNRVSSLIEQVRGNIVAFLGQLVPSGDGALVCQARQRCSDPGTALSAIGQ
ncbi:hypothetical protein D3C78_1307620 [compost metagenome]